MQHEIYNSRLKGKFNTYFNSRLKLKMSTRGWQRCDCPHCGSKMAFGINIHQDRSKCHRCEENLHLIDLVIKFQRLETRYEAFDFLKSFEGEDYVDIPVKVTKRRKVILPKEFKLLSLGTSQMAKIAQRYIESRGFDIDELSSRGIGYCGIGDYKGYLILPFYSKGKIVYFTTRKFIGYGPKFRNPPEQEFGIGKSLLIYNIDSLALYDKIYIVESITNALTLGDRACAISGKSISPWQISTFINSSIKEVSIILDNDAHKDALELGMQLSEYKKVKVTKLPQGIDVNDLGKQKTLKLEKATSRKNYSQLYNELLEL